MRRGTLVLAALAAAVFAVAAGAATSPGSLPVWDSSNAKPEFTTIGGASPLATTRTIPHWQGRFTDPTNGRTYRYIMVGKEDPRNPDAGTTTIPVDVIPLNLVFSSAGGFDLDGTDVVPKTLASPIFQANDYTTTEHAGDDPTVVGASGGALSSGNVGVQYEDAIMRSQFAKNGSDYHLVLDTPTVYPTQTLVVPEPKGQAFQNSRGIPLGLVDIGWFSAKVQELLGSLQIDPTHLPIFLTDNVMLYIGSLDNCCVIGYHGAAMPVGNGAGSTNGNGDQPVNTFAYAAYSRRGTFGTDWIADIHALSHEIAEWGDDPFVDNTVNPWLTPTAPQYGCTGLLETGDPVVGIGFTLPGNPYDSTGYWHPEDEVFLPWFAREDPNTTSEATQSGSGGRYTFLGDLNPYPGFRQPATGC